METGLQVLISAGDDGPACLFGPRSFAGLVCIQSRCLVNYFTSLSVYSVSADKALLLVSRYAEFLSLHLFY